MVSSVANRCFKVLVITGMTGTQKTKLAISAAKRLNGELVCGDLTQMYSGLNLLLNKQENLNEDEVYGDAKAGLPGDGARSSSTPSPAMNPDGVEKHMYSRYKLGRELSTQEYTYEARQAVKDILARGKLPIIEGGSLYGLKNLFKGNSTVETP